MSMVVDIHKVNGIRPPFDVYIGRRIQYHEEFTQDSKWANRFYHDLAGYERHVREDLWDDLDELDGKVLGCWCVTTDQLEPVQCHGQVLMRLLREKRKNEKTNKCIYCGKENAPYCEICKKHHCESAPECEGDED
jgi:hypothetical protein